MVLEEQVDVVRHQSVGQDVTRVDVTALSEFHEVVLVIRSVRKNALTVVSPESHMVNPTKDFEAWRSRHPLWCQTPS